MPPQTIEMDGMEFTTFANIEADVLQEYGDVRNELVVKTHGKTFLSAAHLEWDVIDAEFTRLVKATVSPLTPGLSPEAFAEYTPVAGKVCIPPADASFDEIMVLIVQENAAEVHLQGDNQVYWAMDIKRLAPAIHLSVRFSSLIAAKRAAHLRQFIDAVTATSPDLLSKYNLMVEALTSVLGDRRFPGSRKIDDIL